jgi:hypothetical protein
MRAPEKDGGTAAWADDREHGEAGIAFDRWLTPHLRSTFDAVLREPVPAAMLRMLVPDAEYRPTIPDPPRSPQENCRDDQ